MWHWWSWDEVEKVSLSHYPILVFLITGKQAWWWNSNWCSSLTDLCLLQHGAISAGSNLTDWSWNEMAYVLQKTFLKLVFLNENCCTHVSWISTKSSLVMIGKSALVQIIAQPGLILGLRPANEKCRYKVMPSLISHWLGANLESALLGTELVPSHCLNQW